MVIGAGWRPARRNREGFALARGEILTWLNSDDVYLRPGAVELMRTGADVVTGGGKYLVEAGRFVALIPIRRGQLGRHAIERVDSSGHGISLLTLTARQGRAARQAYCWPGAKGRDAGRELQSCTRRFHPLPAHIDP